MVLQVEQLSNASPKRDWWEEKKKKKTSLSKVKDKEVVAFSGIFKWYKPLKAVKIPEIRIFPREYTFFPGFTRDIVKQNPGSLFSAGEKPIEINSKACFF